MESDLLVVEIEERRFGLPAGCVREVVRAIRPMPLPRRPDTSLGVINLRGQVIPVIDTRRLLDLSSRDVYHSDQFVILEEDGLRCALHIDRAVDLTSLIQTPEEPADPEGSSKSNGSILANTRHGCLQRLTLGELLTASQRQTLRQTELISSPDRIDTDEPSAR